MPIILSKKRLEQAIENPELDGNKGKFLAVNPDLTCVAVDNRSGDAWTEEFTSIKAGLNWLNDKFEMYNFNESKVKS